MATKPAAVARQYHALIARSRDVRFRFLLRQAGLPEPTKEYRAIPGRRFAFDYAWPTERLALEVEGGVWSRGAHGRGWGIIRDMTKYNLATLHGWAVLRVVPRLLDTPHTIELVRQGLASRTR